MDNDAQSTPVSRRRFRIFVAGRLDERFTSGVDGIELGESPDGSTLEGPLVDQSHVRGIMDRLWQLGIEVVKFETYQPDPEESHN